MELTFQRFRTTHDLEDLVYDFETLPPLSVPAAVATAAELAASGEPAFSRASGNMLATTTPTKWCLPAAVSNFGAYALCGALALHTKRPELMIDGDMIRTLITTVNTLGELDGSTVDPHFLGDDGIPIDAVARVVDLIRDIVAQWGRTIHRNF